MLMEKVTDKYSFINTINIVFRLISSKKRIWLYLAAFLSITSALAESFTLLLIPIFIATLEKNSAVDTVNAGQLFFSGLLNIIESMGINVYILIFVFLLLSTILQFANTRLITILPAYISNDISTAIVKFLTRSNYSKFLTYDKSEVLNCLTLQLSSFEIVLTLTLNTFTSLTVSIGLIAVLLFIAPKITLSSFVLIGIYYFLISSLVKKSIYQNSKKIATKNAEKVSIIQNIYRNKKQLLLTQNYFDYENPFLNADKITRMKTAQNLFCSMYPKHILELLTISVLLLFGWYLSSFTNTNVVATLGSFGFAAQRLIPYSQRIYGGIIGVRSHHQDINDIYMLKLSSANHSSYKNKNEPQSMQSDMLQQNLLLAIDNVSYYYKSDKNRTLESGVKNVNLSISKYEKIGILGLSGSGKSTLVDLIMGFIEPVNGSITYILNQQTVYPKEWQNSIGYSSINQELLENKSIKYLISNEESPDMNRVRKAAEDALINEVISNLPDGYDTILNSQRGGFSAGQVQRLNIANMIYSDRPIWILDEATSGLDKATEYKIIKKVLMKKNKTVFFITHNTMLFDSVDRIILLDKHEIKYIGTPKVALEFFHNLTP